MSNSSPRISVIIPTLLEEKYIQRTLKQFTPEIKEQFGIEVIVSDGGSKDQTACLAEGLADLILVHRGKERQTISGGRNEGARAARGSLFVFLNGDTVIAEAERFFTVVRSSFEDPAVIAATCDVTIYPEEEIIADKLFHGFFNFYFKLLNKIGIGMGRGECQVVRSERFFEVGGYDQSLVAGEDFNLFVQLHRLGKIAYLPSMKVWESPRRFRRFGYRRITLLWFLNALSVFFRGKSATKDWEPIR